MPEKNTTNHTYNIEKDATIDDLGDLGIDPADKVSIPSNEILKTTKDYMDLRLRNEQYHNLSILQNCINNSQNYYKEKITLNLTWRFEFATQIGKHLKLNEKYLLEAIQEDLGISCFEAYQTELAPVYDEIRYFKKNLHKIFKIGFSWTQSKFFPLQGRTYCHPYGVVCVIANPNNPLASGLIPAIDALAAGNCVILKTSDRTPATSDAIYHMLSNFFRPEYFLPISGGDDLDNVLTQGKFDAFFFSGKKDMALKINKAASEHFTPVVIHTNGNSICYLDDYCDVKNATKKIMWGKLLHCGQLLHAPSFILCNKYHISQFVENAAEYLKSTYGKTPIDSPFYPRMLDEKAFDESLALLEGLSQDSQILLGGNFERSTLKIAPTIILVNSIKDSIFSKNIVGPILPILPVEDLSEASTIIDSMSAPPALYLFTISRKTRMKMLEYLDYGSACVNDVVLQTMTPWIPYGSPLGSGLGLIGGRYGFDSFTHKQGAIISSPGGGAIKRFSIGLNNFNKIKRRGIYKENKKWRRQKRR